MAISQEIRVDELWYMCSALLQNVSCQSLKFQVDGFHSLEVMVQTRIHSEN